MNTLPLRPNVCMIVFNNERKIFLGERHSEPGIWQFPQGGAEPELSLEENVLKELEEELGAPRTKFQIVKKLKATHEYEFQRTPPYAVGKWRGQSQTFWLVRFLGNDSDITLHAHTPEFTAFKWCTIEEVKTTAEPKRVPGYLEPLLEASQLI